MDLTNEQRVKLQALRDQLIDVLASDVSLKRCISQTIGGLEDRLGLARTIPRREDRRRQHGDASQAHGYADTYKVENYLKR